MDSSFFDDKNTNNTKRFSFGIAGSLLTHILIVLSICFFLPHSQRVVSANIRNPAIDVSVSFFTPAEESRNELPKEPVIQKQPQKIVKNTLKTVKPEPVQKKPLEKKPEKKIVQKPAKMPVQKTVPVQKTIATQKSMPVEKNTQQQELNTSESATASSQQVTAPSPSMGKQPLASQSVKQSAQQTAVKSSEPARDIIPIISDTGVSVRRVQPEYPKRALRMRQEGIVLLRVLISKTGVRQNIKLHKPSQYALLNQAAIEAVKKWRFGPNIVNGQAIASWVQIPIEFRIR